MAKGKYHANVVFIPYGSGAMRSPCADFTEDKMEVMKEDGFVMAYTTMIDHTEDCTPIASVFHIQTYTQYSCIVLR